MEKITSREILEFARGMGQLDAFSDVSDDDLWAAVEAEREGGGGKFEPRTAFDLKVDEWAMFSDPSNAPRSRDFELREVSVPFGYESSFERVVLVERLRVVKALTGFTRLVSPGDYADPSEIPEIWRGPLARSAPDWVPAAEVRGEGVFIQFSERALAEWSAQKQVKSRIDEFQAAHTAFRRARHIPDPEQNFPGGRYILIHSLSHALLRQFSIECGYSAASLQERIYSRESGAGEDPMAGVLLYTAASDSEGTLGGLVSLGKPENLGRHLDLALEAMRLCASDPLCSEHTPSEEGTSLHGACCHACLFASETSCERGNKYLDRSTLVQTIGGVSMPYFPERE